MGKKLKVLVAQSPRDPLDYSPPGSSIHGILQARILEWVAIPFSRDLPDPGIEPMSPALPADSLTSEPPGKPNIGLESISKTLITSLKTLSPVIATS